MTSGRQLPATAAPDALRGRGRDLPIPEHHQPDRLFIVGGSGSGKSTLGMRLAHQLGIPIHHLDEVARQGGGTGVERSTSERMRDIGAILTQSRWIAEGIHLDWTRDLVEAADVVLWLDHVSWRRSSGNIIRRFVRDAMAEVRRQKGHRKFSRWRDYARRLSELARAIPEARTYHRTPGGEGAVAVSRAATETFLAPYGHKVVRCRTEDDVTRFLGDLTARVP